ncbi:hypothetical protein AB0I94_33640 [Streptomyces sp. NPDC050147]|uniref:hypothetical protein n=1 Tax=Streptomyces sp. NPDC050147 TaxID=3155513 RepID=UPI0034220AAC
MPTTGALRFLLDAVLSQLDHRLAAAGELIADITVEVRLPRPPRITQLLPPRHACGPH